MEKISKHQRWYERLCANAQGRESPTAYTEVHHIQPRSLGGSDAPSNLVRLTYKEHFMAHRLLTKFKTGRDLQKMLKALWAMTLRASGDRTPTARQFEIAKKALRDSELENDDAAYLDRWREKKTAKIYATHADNSRIKRACNAKEFLHDLWLVGGWKGAKRTEIRALLLKKYKALSKSEFDHELIAKYFDAPLEVSQDYYRFLLLGKRRYLAEKYSKAS